MCGLFYGSSSKYIRKNLKRTHNATLDTKKHTLNERKNERHIVGTNRHTHTRMGEWVCVHVQKSSNTYSIDFALVEYMAMETVAKHSTVCSQGPYDYCLNGCYCYCSQNYWSNCYFDSRLCACHSNRTQTRAFTFHFCFNDRKWICNPMSSLSVPGRMQTQKKQKYREIWE